MIAAALDSLRRRRAPGAGRRSVRGDLHGLPGRRRARRFTAALVAGAADPDGRGVVVLAIRGDFYGRCAEHAELSARVSANHVLVGPMRRDELRRAIELPAAARGAAGRAAAGRGAGRRRRGRARRAAAPLHHPARAVGAARGARLRPRATSEAAASAARSRGWPRAPTGASPRPSGAGRGRSCCASPAPRRGGGGFVRRRVPLAELEVERDEDAAGRSRCSPRAGSSPSTRARSRSPTRRSSASGRGCAPGSRRTPRAGASTST